MIYGVMQLNHGHEYRWLFTEDEVSAQFQAYNIVPFEGEVELWPIGGSNSGVATLTELENDEAIKCFLTDPGEGPDVEDPMLVDIAEYLVTVDTGYGACTQEYLDKFGFQAEHLTQRDDKYHRFAQCEKMIATLKSVGYEDFDYERPFYGENRDMRYSELCSLYEQCIGRSSGM